MSANHTAHIEFVPILYKGLKFNNEMQKKKKELKTSKGFEWTFLQR